MIITLDTLTTRSIVLAAAIAAGIRRGIRIFRAVMGVATRYIPWLAAVFTVCLIIPGPLDELGAILVVAVYAAFKPDMRAELGAAVRTA